MAVSPMAGNDGPVTVSIKSAGKALPDTAQVISVAVRAEINRIPEAIVVLQDGDLAEQDYPLTDAATFKPGTEVSIGAGYGEDEPTVLFTGLVTGLRLKIGGTGAPQLIVTCRDKGFRMTLGRNSQMFESVTDSDAISTIASAAGLSAEVAATQITHAQLVQHRCTDWDFVLSRAEANGLIVSCDAGKLTVAKPDTSAAAALVVTAGVDLIRFDCEMDVRSQFSSAAASGWSIADQAAVSGSAATATGPSWGDLDGKALATVGALASFDVGSAAPYSESELTAIAGAIQTRSALARIRGQVRFQGSGLAKPGGTLELKGVGARFGGTAIIGSVVHRIEGGDWVTDAGLGIDPETLSSRESEGFGAPGAGGFTAPVRGLQIGKVTKLAEDPDAQARVQVQLPLFGADGGPKLWARLGCLQATGSAGTFFLPEVGDEVVVGFFAEDPGYPVVLGSLYSSVNAAPFTATDDNYTKAIVTRAQLKATFDDEKKVITLETPGGNSAVLDDDGKSVKLKDAKGNSVLLDQSGITLDSPGDIAIKATGGIKISATGDVSISGANVSAEAEMGLTAKGNASAELSASGQVTVKGAMVMIN